MFVELTEVDQGKFFVNINSIEHVALLDHLETALEMISGKVIYVNESYGEVIKLIKNEVAAERGY